MAGFYFTFLALLLSGLGARDQVAVAQLSLRQGQRPAVLIAGVAIACATAAFAAWAAALVAPVLPSAGRTVLAALALALAGVESLLVAPSRTPREPTNSLGALGFVLLYHQMTDAARFLVFALAVATNAPVPAGLAGAAGGSALLLAGWLFPQAILHPRVRLARRIVGGLLLLLALTIGLQALDRL